MPNKPTVEAPAKPSAIDDEYLLALGRFVHAFSAAESMLHSLLVHHAGMSKGTGAALLSGVRVKHAMESVNRLFEYWKRDKEKAALQKPFQQLGEILSIRDHLLHYGAQEDESGKLFVTNVERKHLPERATTRLISIVDLEAMTSDLRIIANHFFASMWLRLESDWADPEVVAAFNHELQLPWRYKPQATIPLPKKRSAPPQA
jgi:hypothetical protein